MHRGISQIVEGERFQEGVGVFLVQVPLPLAMAQIVVVVVVVVDNDVAVAVAVDLADRGYNYSFWVQFFEVAAGQEEVSEDMF